MNTHKTLVYKPGLQTDLGKRPKSKPKEEKISFKERIKEFVLNTCLVLSGVLFFVISVSLGYKTYILLNLKVEKHHLIKKNQELKARYQALTSREVVLEKAKKIGLVPPQKEDYIYLN